MTISILKTLAVLPSGERYDTLTWDELSQYLRDNCDTREDQEREQRHQLRDRLYRDGGCDYMCEVIDGIFDDPRVAKLRKKWVKHARFSNPLKRTVGELATMYQRPAVRSVSGERDQQMYTDLLADVKMDERSLHFNRLLVLHRTLLIGFRVRVNADGSRTPSVYACTPGMFRPILDPSDSHVLGWLVRTGYRPAGARGLTAAKSSRPAWVLWTDHERALLRADMTVIEGSYAEHGFGIAPVVPISMTPTDVDFWPGEDGEDLVAARVAGWLVNVLMLKETKSATKMPIVTGDLSRAARDQAMDNESIMELPEGAAMTTVDNSMDLNAYQGVSDHIADSSGMNYGLTPTLVRNQGVQSADARDLMRIPLNELREQQKLPWRDLERALAVVMSRVCANDLPEYAFSVDGWKIDFAEGATPLGQTDEFALFEKKRAALLDNPVDFLKRVNPDLTDEESMRIIERNNAINTLVQMMMRPMNAISGADLGGDPALVAQRQAEMAGVQPEPDPQSTSDVAQQPDAATL